MADYQLNIKLNGVEQAVSSVGDMEKALEQTNEELSKIDKNSKGFSELNKQSKTIESQFTSTTKSAENLGKSINDVTGSVKNLGSNITKGGTIAEQLNAGGTSAKKLSTDINDTVTKSMSLRLELRKITQELQGLEPGSARFQELSLRAGQLRDTIADTSGVISSLAGTGVERLGKALSTTAQIGVAGFQGVAAASALFGGENEEVQKTLVKLTALLNLSQALTTFGGLGDKVTELKAGFLSLFPAAASSAGAITATAVATEGEAIASGEAAVATTGFAVALNALPLVAIVTALGLVVAGLISYASAEGDAEKAKAKRLEATKAQIEEDKKSRKQIAEQSGEFVLQIKTLAATNKGSAERKKLIKEINDTYNTTLQNLSDEKLFQKQLNLEVANYIAYQKARFKLDKNQKAADLNLEKQSELESKILKTKKERAFWDNEVARLSKLQEPLGLGDAIAKQESYNLKIAGFQKEIDEANVRLNEYGKINLNVGEVIKEIEGKTGKYVEGLDKTNKGLGDVKTATDFYAQSLKSLSDFQKSADDEELKLQQSRVERTESKIDDLEFEKDVTLAKIIVEYTAQKKAIEDNITDEKKRKQLFKELDIAFNRSVLAINTKSLEDYEETNKKRVEDYKKTLDDLKLAEQILANEITFGNNNVSDSLTALALRRKQVDIDFLESSIQNNKLSLSDFEDFQKTKETLLNQANNLQLQISKEQAEAERKLQIAEVVKFYDNKKELDVEFDEITKKSTVKVNQDNLKEVEKQNKEIVDAKVESKILSETEGKAEIDKLNKEANESLIKQAEETQKIINKQSLNLTEESNVKELEAEVKFATTKVNIEKEANEQIGLFSDERLERFSAFLALAEKFAQGLSEINNLANQNEDQAQTARNEAFIAGEQAKANALQAAYDADIAANNYTEDEKKAKQKETTDAIENIQKNSNKAIDESNRELAKNQFKRQKALNIVNAVISGAQAVLSAISQFGPPPSPAGIAGIVAAGIITAAQIAAISKQKFDGGSTGAPTSVSTPTIPDTTSASSSPISSASSGGFTGFNEGLLGSPGEGAGATGTLLNNGSQRVYILESDITSTQKRVETLESNASFG